MSDDEADPELLALLAQSLGLGPKPEAPPSTGVLKSIEYVYNNALDVSISSQGTKAAAELLYHQLQQRQYSTREWSKHELHPKPSGVEATVNFIFTMNLLNFSFWSELPEPDRFCVEWNGKRWTGYWSLVAALQRALSEGHPMTTPSYWSTCTDEDFSHIFRSATAEPIPLLSERIEILRTASIVWSDPATSPLQMIVDAHHSAARLVNLLTTHLPSCFADTASYNGKLIHLHKRAQILVADLWACFNGTSHGSFDDIDTALTMFADYRVPQMLQRLGVLWYSPRLEGRVRRGESFESGEALEVEVRACSVWAVELLRREMAKRGWDEWDAEVEVVEDQSEDGEKTREDGQLTGSDAAAEHQQADTTNTNDDTVIASDAHAQADTTTDQGVERAAEHPEPVASGPTGSDPVQSETVPTTEAENPPPANRPITSPPTTEATTPSQPTPLTHDSTTPPPQTKTVRVTLNAILLDYLLYDVAKEQEQALLLEAQAQKNGNAGVGEDAGPGPDGSKVLPHHRTRSIWY